MFTWLSALRPSLWLSSSAASYISLALSLNVFILVHSRPLMFSSNCFHSGPKGFLTISSIRDRGAMLSSSTSHVVRRRTCSLSRSWIRALRSRAALRIRDRIALYDFEAPIASGRTPSTTPTASKPDMRLSWNSGLWWVIKFVVWCKTFRKSEHANPAPRQKNNQ